MTRSELIDKLGECNKELEPEVVEQATKLILGTMLDALVDNDRIEIRGFGSFSLRRLKAHDARNPKTGEPISVGNRFSIYFRPGKLLREKVNAGKKG